MRLLIFEALGKLTSMIAAIAKVHHAAIATRNTKDFEGCEIRVLNPWAGE